MFPSPRLCKFGRDSCRDSQMWPNVSEPASPHSGASGIAPMPAPSRTIRVILLKGWFIRLERLFFVLVKLYNPHPRKQTGFTPAGDFAMKETSLVGAWQSK